jgi:2-hydroxycyclohexanecarboxyl-CoA dehydrogenase
VDLGLAQKVVVVTGATANIGRAIALDFACEGAKVVVVGRDVDAGDRVVSDSLARGAAEAVFVAADMTDPASPARVLAAAEALGPVEVLVNNVGGQPNFGLFVDSDPTGWQTELDLNLTTTLRMTHAVLPGMIERKSGRIINIGSISAIVGVYMFPAYSAAKGAVHAFTKVLAKEVGRHGITVNCVAPNGTIASDPAAFSTGSAYHPELGTVGAAIQGLPPEDLAMLLRAGPLDRTICEPEEISAATLYLASKRASYVTGQVLAVDGGTLL